MDERRRFHQSESGAVDALALIHAAETQKLRGNRV